MNCKLCDAPASRVLTTDARRLYRICNVCGLVFVPENFHVSTQEERARYALHDNTANNPEYVEYLRGVAGELRRIPIDKPNILDYGCGKDPVLTEILRDRGFACTPYDPLYAPGHTLPSGRFDIIILCEVIEHIRNLKRELRTINDLFTDTGFLFIKTELYHDADAFGTWWYAQDTTHINFFSLDTMRFIASNLNKDFYYTNGKNCIIFEQKKGRK